MHSAVRIQREDFDIGTEWAACRQRCGGATGAIVAFGGLVRDLVQDQHPSSVRGLYLEHYPGMTEASIEKILVEAAERWRLLDVLVIHRIGNLLPQEQIVLVLAASSHRPDAFAAGEFIMDYLKTDAVFWKKERREGEEVWLHPTSGDQQRRVRWRTAEGAG